MNGEDFKGSIPLDEARNAIFCQAIGLQGSLLHSVKMNYDKIIWSVAAYKWKEESDRGRKERKR